MAFGIPNFFPGLSGLELPVPKYQFPPEFQNSSRLTYYSSFFNTIEINNSFYTLPMVATVSRWASSVPDDFRFTFKLLRDITHVNNLMYDDSLIKKFMQVISNVGKKRGAILVQFPPGLKEDNIHQLDRLLVAIGNTDMS